MKISMLGQVVMANFYTEERITISRLEDITSRPGYESSVPPRKSLFRYVKALYSFPRKIASCSVSDCYQNHKKGYLVHTADGGECSICESCAKRFMDPELLKPPKRRARTRNTATERNSSTWIPIRCNGGSCCCIEETPSSRPYFVVVILSVQMFRRLM